MPLYFTAPDGKPLAVKITRNGQETEEKVDRWGKAHVALTGEPGRVNVFDVPLSNPSQGVAAARTDGKTTLNLLDMPGAGEVIASLPGNRKAVVETGTRKAQRGHPNGEHFYLPLVNNRFVCEPGRNHRKIYISKSASALTKAAIAAHATAAGTATTEAQVTGAWLAARPQYGGTPQMAITPEILNLYRETIYSSGTDITTPASNHYFLERGYDYTDLDVVTGVGESEIHPQLYGAWGSGAKPIVTIGGNWIKPPYTVYQDLQEEYVAQLWYAWASAFDHVTVEKSMDLQYTHAFTIHEVDVVQPWKDSPAATTTRNGVTVWLANGNHMGCIYSHESSNLLVEGLAGDHPGWADGYDYNGDATMPMPPFKYSHAIYLSSGCFDVTIRDNVLTRAASDGLQLRAGVHVEGNVLADHNLIASINSGMDAQFNNVMDNVAFSAGFKRVAYEEGGYNWGYGSVGLLSSFKGNVLAHHANPDDAAEIAAKPDAADLLTQGVKLADDTQVWKWGPISQNRNVTGLDATVLDQTTLQRYAGLKLGTQFATIGEYAAWVKTQPSVSAAAKDTVDWVKARFGKPRSTRTTPANLDFSPDPAFEGFRWDNRYNWSTMDLPGRNVADAVNLRGHYSKFGNMNADIASLTSGGGTVDVVSGRLKIGALLDAAKINTRLSGQAILPATAHPLTVKALSGRVALLGAVSNLDLTAVGHAEVLLGPDCTIPSGKSLVTGCRESPVGWDGTGTANLTVAGTLKFSADMEVTVDVVSLANGRYVWGHIGKRVTGSISGATATVAQVHRRAYRGGLVKVSLTEIVGTPVVNDVFTFQPKREAGYIDTPVTGTVKSIVSRGIASLQRFRSGYIGDGTVAPTVTVTLTLAAGSAVVVDATGLPAGSYDLTGPGVTVVNQGATLPAGVTVTGGKLVLVVS